MGATIDAAGEPGGDAEAGIAQFAGDAFGELDAGRGGIARTDDRDHRHGQRGSLAAHGKQRRRIVDHLQAQRVVRLAGRHQADTHRGGRLELALGIGARTDAGRTRRAASAGELRQALERRFGTAAMLQQRPEGAWSDVLAADQPQPVDPVLVGEAESRSVVPQSASSLPCRHQNGVDRGGPTTTPRDVSGGVGPGLGARKSGRPGHGQQYVNRRALRWHRRIPGTAGCHVPQLVQCPGR